MLRLLSGILHHDPNLSSGLGEVVLEQSAVARILDARDGPPDMVCADTVREAVSVRNDCECVCRDE